MILSHVCVLFVLLFLLIAMVVRAIWLWTIPLDEIQRESRHNLRAFLALCETKNTACWAAFGTLLGAVREGGMIPYDDDCDVGMLKSDFDRLRPEIEKRFEVITFLPILGNIEKSRDYVKLREKSVDSISVISCLDVFLYTDDHDDSTKAINNYWKSHVKKEDVALSNLETKKFGTDECGEEYFVPVPRNPEQYLIQEYGDSWQTPMRCMNIRETSSLYVSLVISGIATLLIALSFWFVNRSRREKQKKER